MNAQEPPVRPDAVNDPGDAAGLRVSGLQAFLGNLKNLGVIAKNAFVRHGWPIRSERDRSRAVFQNFFLHIHSTRTHRWSLRPSFTLGLGVMAFGSFLVLSVTGIFLMIYYQAGIPEAYQTVKDLSFVSSSGKYVRNIHRWAAHFMVFAVFAHMTRVFYTSSYRAPREFNWLIGVGLLVLTLGLSFTGYLLPWDQLAFWAITIGSNIAASPREITDALGMTGVFDIGGLQRELLLGGSEVGQGALTRFYLLHVILLPAAAFALLGVHFWRIRKDGGLSRPPDAAFAGDPGVTGKPAFVPSKTYGLMALVRGKTPAVDRGPEGTVASLPHAFRAELAAFMLMLAIVCGLSFFWDAPLKELANPRVPENPAKAPWYFLGLQELVSYSAFAGGMLIPGIVVVGLALIPFLDREQGVSGTWLARGSEKKIFWGSLVFGLASVIGVVAFTVKFGWLRSWYPGIPQLVITVVNPGTLIMLLYTGFSLLILQRTGSTRKGAVALFTCFLSGFLVLTVVGVYFRGPNWNFYLSPAQWPIH
ncbi:MAG: cytochrome b N-terminal domain-containing protein [Bdellovibrionota bacterium]